MEITIKTEPKEIAALVVAIQERPEKIIEPPQEIIRRILREENRDTVEDRP